MSVTDLGYTADQPATGLPQAASTSDKRILALDVVRGVAVFGILIRNVYLFAMPTSAFALPAAWSAESAANFVSWIAVDIFFDGSMRAIFSMLFGASALIILAKCDNAAQGLVQAERYYRRLLVLIGFGLIHAYLLLWPNDVLFFYGVFGLLLFPLRNLSARSLLMMGGAAILFFAAIQIINSLPEPELTLNEAPIAAEEQADSATAPDAESQQDVATQVAEVLHATWQQEIELRHSGYLVNLLEGVALAIEHHTSELMTSHVFDIGAMLLIGMALFKLGFLSGQLSASIYVVVMVVGYGLGVPLKVAALNNWFQMLPDPYSSWEWGTINFDISRLAIALGHLSALMLLLRLRVFSLLARLLAGSGRLALTNYLTHTLVGAFVFYGFGLGLFGQFDHAQVLTLAILLGAMQIILSNIYLSHFRHGPFEYLLRALVDNGKRRAIKRTI